MTAATSPPPDPAILGRWLDQAGAPGAGILPVSELLSGGSQNTLFRIRRGPASMVLRMPGPRADDERLRGLRREIQLVRALSGTDVPHAALIAADDDGSVLGAPGYVMADIDGWSPMDGGWAAPFDTDLQVCAKCCDALPVGLSQRLSVVYLFESPLQHTLGAVNIAESLC